jgi:hypothetical protein
MYEFLKSITFKEDMVVKKHKLSTEMPEGFVLRVYSSGRVYPSKELVQKFDLEYAGVEIKEGTETKKKETEGNGVDFFEAHQWGPYPKDKNNAILIAFTPRKETRLDLFNRVPTKSVIQGGIAQEKVISIVEQGPVCKELWELAVKIYDLESKITATTKFLDLEVLTEYPIKTENGIYLIPKVVSRGEQKGNMGTYRRENIEVFPLVPLNRDQLVEQVDLMQNLIG